MDIDICRGIGIDKFIGLSSSLDIFVVRNFLLIHNYVFNLLIKRIRKTKNPFLKEEKIRNFAKSNHLNKVFVRDYVSDRNCNLNSIDHHPYMRISTPEDPIKEDGFFIKVDPKLNIKGAMKLIKYFKDIYESPIFVKNSFFERNQQGLSSKSELWKEALRIYLDCEKRIPKAVNEIDRLANFNSEDERKLHIMKYVFTDFIYTGSDSEMDINKMDFDNKLKFVKKKYYLISDNYQLLKYSDLKKYNVKCEKVTLM